jgi:hypothetical protein
MEYRKMFALNYKEDAMLYAALGRRANRAGEDEKEVFNGQMLLIRINDLAFEPDRRLFSDKKEKKYVSMTYDEWRAATNSIIGYKHEFHLIGDRISYLTIGAFLEKLIYTKWKKDKGWESPPAIVRNEKFEVIEKEEVVR